MRRRGAGQQRRQNLVIGAVLIAAITVGLYVAFTRPHPLAHPYKLRAVLTSSGGVRPGFTPVRIAGVDVGRVADVTSTGNGSQTVLTLDLGDSALPVHRDATIKLRPRLFLEGNSFIELHPGSPSSPEASSGTTIPLSQTSAAVTFPHVLGALTSDTRRNLQLTLQGLGSGLAHRPTTAEDVGQPAFARGLSGAEALNRVLHDGANMLPQSAVVAEATTGTRHGDLHRAIDGFGRTAEALDNAGPRLPGLLAHLRLTSAAFAAESSAVTTSLRSLPATLTSTRTALVGLRTALPPALELVRATDQALPALPAALRNGTPWFDQLRALLGQDEFGGDLEQLVPATRDLAAAETPSTGMFTQLDLLSRCSNRVLTPTANARIADGPRTAGTSTFSELLSGLVGLAGTSQSFDGNGGLLRAHAGGGAIPVTSGRSRVWETPIYGNALSAPLGTRPSASLPAASKRPDVACANNAAPDLNGPSSAFGPADGSAKGGR